MQLAACCIRMRTSRESQTVGTSNIHVRSAYKDISHNLGRVCERASPYRNVIMHFYCIFFKYANAVVVFPCRSNMSSPTFIFHGACLDALRENFTMHPHADYVLCRENSTMTYARWKYFYEISDCTNLSISLVWRLWFLLYFILSLSSLNTNVHRPLMNENVSNRIFLFRESSILNLILNFDSILCRLTLKKVYIIFYDAHCIKNLFQYHRKFGHIFIAFDH